MACMPIYVMHANLYIQIQNIKYFTYLRKTVTSLCTVASHCMRSSHWRLSCSGRQFDDFSFLRGLAIVRAGTVRQSSRGFCAIVAVGGPEEAGICRFCEGQCSQPAEPGKALPLPATPARRPTCGRRDSGQSTLCRTSLTLVRSLNTRYHSTQQLELSGAMRSTCFPL